MIHILICRKRNFATYTFLISYHKLQNINSFQEHEGIIITLMYIF